MQGDVIQPWVERKKHGLSLITQKTHYKLPDSRWGTERNNIPGIREKSDTFCHPYILSLE